MSKVLLVDTNFSSKPIYDFLNNGQNEVFVVGANTNDFLAKSVKKYININYSDIDQMKSLIDDLDVDYILPGCNDRSYQVCSILNSKRKFAGIDSEEITEKILNKEKFRTFANEIGLPVPQVLSPEQVDNHWPVIIKPADAYSGHGITLLNEQQKNLLSSVVEHAMKFSRTNTVLIEEFKDGQLFSHSAFISNGSIYIDFIVEEHSTANQFVVDTSRVVFDFPKKMLLEIRKNITKLARSLDLADGLIHTQFIKQENRFWIIEITRRCPGDLYSMLIELSTGFRYAEAYAKSFLNQKINFPKNNLNSANIIRHTVSQPAEKIFTSLKFNIAVDIEKLVPLSLAGDIVKASPYGRIALLFLKARSEHELKAIFEKTLQRELYSIQ